MKTDIASQEKNIITVKAEFAPAEIKNAIEKTLKKLSQNAGIKGFRKGHIPRKALELYFTKKGIYAKVMEDIIPNAVHKIIEDYDLNLITEPELKHNNMEEGKPFEFEAKFEVVPEVTLPDVEAIEAEKVMFRGTERMRDENIKRLLEVYGDVVPTYEERELKPDDYVSVKYTSSIIERDGSLKIVENKKKTEINLAQPALRPEIVTALVGKKPGDTASLDFAVDKGTKNKELAGKTMRYDIEILGIMKKQAAELTDEKAAEISRASSKTVDEFKAEIMKQIEESAESRRTESLRESAVDKLVGLSDVEIPDTLISRQVNMLKAEQAEIIKQKMNMSPDEYFKTEGTNIEANEKDITETAKAIVKRALVLGALADANNIEWTHAELNEEIKLMALAMHGDPKKFRDYVYSDRDKMFEIAERIRNRKAVDFLISKVKVKEVEPAEPKDVNT